MNIRLMKIADFNKVFHLWHGTAGMGLRSLDDSEAGIQRFLDRNPSTCFVAEIDSEIAGVILAGHDGRRGYIYHAAVKPEYRRSGLGSSLVHAVIEAMAREQINKIALVVFGENELGNQFWESVGFAQRDDLVYRNRSINEENE